MNDALEIKVSSHARWALIGVCLGAAACGSGASPSPSPEPGRATAEAEPNASLPAMPEELRERIGTLTAPIERPEESPEQISLIKVPRFKGSFVYDGETYPYDVLGGDPTLGGTTKIRTVYLPLTFVIEPAADAGAGDAGGPITFDATAITSTVLGSPNFQDASYATGVTQYEDAQQRASFWSTMKPDWHTLLGAPRVLPAVTITVPAKHAQVFQVGGLPFANVAFEFFLKELSGIIAAQDIKADEMLMALSYDVELGGGVGGFHSPSHDFSPGAAGLFIWSGWVDPLVSPGYSDALALAHEIGESFDDPTGRTAVPKWSFPKHPKLCQGNLEVGDPLEVLRRSPYPVTIGGVTYHPQNLVLLPWFSRQVPSSAFDGAYTFPNTKLVTVPSLPCERGDAGPADSG